MTTVNAKIIGLEAEQEIPTAKIEVQHLIEAVKLIEKYDRASIGQRELVARIVDGQLHFDFNISPVLEVQEIDVNFVIIRNEDWTDIYEVKDEDDELVIDCQDIAEIDTTPAWALEKRERAASAFRELKELIACQSAT